MMKLDTHLIASTRPMANSKNIVLWGDFRITVLADRLFRLEEDREHVFCDEATEAVWFRDMAPVDFTTEEKNGKLHIVTEKATLVVGKTKEDCYVLLNGKEIALDNKENLGGTYTTLDNCDGNLTKKDREGTLYEPIRLDMGVISKNGVAVLDYSSSSVLTAEGLIRKERHDSLDLYIFAYGRDYRAAIRAFYMICGDTPKLPRYALGNWWSRYYEYTDREYLNVLDRLKTRDIPITVATVDMDWHWNTRNLDRVKKITEQGKDGPEYGGRGGWTGYSWNTELFPDHRRFLKQVHERGCAVTLNLHPAAGVRWFEDMYEEMATAMGVDPKCEKPIPFDFTDTAFINHYFKILHKPYEKDGVDFWWIDWQQGARGKERGLNIMWALNHYHTLDNAENHETPLILSRYSGIGAHRYPLGFSGDTQVTWKTLDFLPYFTANASNIGFTWWSHDIGGHFAGIKDDEMFLRFVQFGVFSPINRLHCTSSPYCTKEPTYYMGGAGRIAEEFLRLRHQLIPYLYSAMLDTHDKGRALIEPMYYEYAEEEEAYHFPNQYLFGTELIVRPVTTKGDSKGMAKTDVWLPKGRWTDIFTGEIYEGNRIVSMVRWMDSIPVLAKEGGFLVLDARQHTNDLSAPDHLHVMAMNGNGSYTLREDQASTVFTAKAEVNKQIVTIQASNTLTRKITLAFRNIKQGDVNVFANGVPMEAAVNADDYLVVTMDEVKAGLTYTIEVVYAYDARAYRDERFLDALTRLEIPFDRKETLWNFRYLDDEHLKAKILMDVSLSENDRIKLSEAW